MLVLTVRMKRGFTLVEVMIGVAILTLIFGAILAFLVSSDNSWKIGQDKLRQQQQARIALNDIRQSLQYSNPAWQDSSGNSYPVTLGANRIDFYLPRFYPNCCPNCGSADLCTDAQGVVHIPTDIKTLVKVTYKLNPSNPTQLLKKEGTGPEKIVANNINNIVFNCGCPGCISVDDNCPIVDVRVTTYKQGLYSLQSAVALRNQNVSLSGVEIEEPEEGEF